MQLCIGLAGVSLDTQGENPGVVQQGHDSHAGCRGSGTLPQATMRDPQTAGVGSKPVASMRGSTLRARSKSPE